MTATQILHALGLVASIAASVVAILHSASTRRQLRQHQQLRPVESAYQRHWHSTQSDERMRANAAKGN